MDLTAVTDSFDRASKKQKLAESKHLQIIDNIICDLRTATRKLSPLTDNHQVSNAKSNLSVRRVLRELQRELTQRNYVNEIGSVQKDLNLALGKYGKLLEKSFCPDIAKVCREVDWSDSTLSQMIAIHLYWQGHFELGDCFVDEALEPSATPSLKAPFIEMYHILECLKAKNLQPALTWAKSNRDMLQQKGSSLEFELHQLHFLQLLHKGLRPQALQFARNSFGLFSVQHMADIQRLMCCLLWTGRLENCPYSYLFASSMWHDIAQKFTRECSSLRGQSSESPFSVTLSAGAQALPTVLKMATILANKRHEWLQLKQLPIEIDLSKEFQFHSIFSCPVSKDQSSAENPPMLMPCCHLLCKQSLQKLAKGRTFKCPYCPAEVTMSQCKPIYF